MMVDDCCSLVDTMLLLLFLHDLHYDGDEVAVVSFFLYLLPLWPVVFVHIVMLIFVWPQSVI